MVERDDELPGPQPTGTFADKYVLERVIGRGGMGIVWEARHRALNTLVAIKLLRRGSVAQAGARRRFEAEAQITAQIKTRHAVQVFDFGVTDDGQPFLVMERLEGESLAQRLQRGRLDPATTAQYLRQAARALDRAHTHGIVHRDFKPENIFITRDEEGREQIKVMDFGVAKLVGALDATSALPDEEPASRPSGLTRTGALLGTPCYMAPEQIVASTELGPRADVWAFGVVAFECLTGRRPFDANALPRLFERIARGERPRARALLPDLPESVDTWFDRACAVDPAARFDSAGEAASALALALGVPTQPLAFRPSIPDAPRPIQFTPSETSQAPVAFAPTVRIESEGTLENAPMSQSLGTTARVPRRPRYVLPSLVALALVGAAVIGLVMRTRPSPPPASLATVERAAATAPPTPVAVEPPSVRTTAVLSAPATSATAVRAADARPPRGPTRRVPASPPSAPAGVAPAAVAAAAPSAASSSRRSSAFDLPPLGL